MIETHAHIYDAAFDDDREAMLQRARQIGVEQIWMPNCNGETVEPMLRLARQYPGFCLPMMGLHPCYVKPDYEQELAIIESHLKSASYSMIGEIGIDFYWDLQFVSEQENAFRRQLELAKKYALPVCIHSRNAKDNSLNAIVRCCELIENFNFPSLRGIFHCFSGNLEEARRILELNFKLGIGGVATFKNGGLDAVLPYLKPIDLVLETDSPYLAPAPHRGKRNETGYLDLIVERIALLMGVSKAEVIETTTQNAHELIPVN